MAVLAPSLQARMPVIARSLGRGDQKQSSRAQRGNPCPLAVIASAAWQSMSFGCHCERSAAIHAGMKSWIATAFGLAMTKGSGFAMTEPLC